MATRGHMSRKSKTEKSFATAAYLSFFLGVFGIDRFYLGYYWLGIIKLCTFGGFTVWANIDTILILANHLPTASQRQLYGYTEQKKTVLAVIGVCTFLLLVASAIASLWLALIVMPYVNTFLMSF